MNNYHYAHLGPVFFDGSQKFKYKKATPEFNSIKSLDIVDVCPLCGEKHFLMTGKVQIDSIINDWVVRIGFNPISDVYRHKILERRRCLNCGLYFYNYHLSDNDFLYEEITKSVPYYTHFRWEFGAVTDLIEKLKPNSLIEIGAGNGSFVERIKNMVPHILASEYNKIAAKECKNKGIDTTTKDINNIAEKFDIVCAFEVLEHVWDTDSFIKGTINLLNKKGKLILAMPDPEGILSVAGIGHLNLPPHHQFDFSKQALEHIAKKYKLKICDYKKSELEYRHYEKYVEIITKKQLSQPDISGFLELKKQYTGHSHIIVFEKK